MSNELRGYIENPESVPNDPDKVAEILASMEADESGTGDESGTEAKAKPEAKPEGDDKPAESAPTTELASNEAKTEGTPPKEERPVIKAKDGKHELPYSVLEAERRRSRELQQQLAEAQARLEEAAAAKKSGAPVADTAPTDTGVDDLEQAIAAIEEEYGADHELAKPLRAQQAKLRAMEARFAKLDELEAWRKQQEQEAANTAVSAVDEAIDSIPALAALRDEDDPRWDAAVALDNRLMRDPEFIGKPIKERFEHVAELMGLNRSDPRNTPTDLETTVDEKLAAQERRRAPASLSDLPGGATFEQSEQERLESMSVTEIAAKFDKMTPDERDRFLAGL